MPSTPRVVRRYERDGREGREREMERRWGRDGGERERERGRERERERWMLQDVTRILISLQFTWCECV
jgi:hypothetical protein